MLDRTKKRTLFVTAVEPLKPGLRNLLITESTNWTAYRDRQALVQDVGLVRLQYWNYWPNIIDYRVEHYSYDNQKCFFSKLNSG